MELIEIEKLSEKSEEVINIEDISNSKNSTLNDMIKICRINNGIAIAAPQVGIFKRFFVSLIDLLNRTSNPTLYINPSYTKIDNSKKVLSTEGCISYNNGKDKYLVERYNIIQAEWYYFIGDNKLERMTTTLDGDLAVIFQHETDHLNGITIPNKGTYIA